MTEIPTLPSGYLVEYRPAGGDWKLLADLPAWQTDLETTKVELGKSYDFRVMSKGRIEPIPTTPLTRRLSRSVYLETSTIMSEPTVSGPHTLPKQPGMHKLRNVLAIICGFHPFTPYLVPLSSSTKRQRLTECDADTRRRGTFLGIAARTSFRLCNRIEIFG